MKVGKTPFAQVMEYVPWKTLGRIIERHGGEAGVPAGAILDTGELMNDAYLRKRGMFATIQHPVRGPMLMPGWPVKMSDSKVPITCAPLLGAHNVEVYGEWLGYTPEQIAQLRKEEAI